MTLQQKLERRQDTARKWGNTLYFLECHGIDEAVGAKVRRRYLNWARLADLTAQKVLAEREAQ